MNHALGEHDNSQSPGSSMRSALSHRYSWEATMNKFTILFTCWIAMWIMSLGFVGAQGVDITLLHVNDTHSHLEAFGPKDRHLDGTIGGIAKAATIIGKVRATESNVLLLHAGDMFHGDFFYNKYFGVPEFQLMQQLGFDAMAVGNHEFEFGPDLLYGSLATAQPGFPLLSANTDLSGYPNLEQFIAPAVMIDKFGPKIAIFGMTVPEDPTEMPAPVKILSDVVTIAYNTVDSLRTKAGADVVICLSHLGSLYDQAVAANVPGIDIIVGGHDHYVFEQPLSVVNPLGGSTLILQAGAYYEHIGKLKLHIENGKVLVAGYRMLDVDASIPRVPEIQAVVDKLKKGIVEQYGDVYDKVEGFAVFDMSEHFDPASSLRDSPLGDLVTDACRRKTRTDIAFAAHGFLGEKIYRGPIVGADIFRPLANGYDEATGLGFKLVTMNLTGMDIITGLEATLSYLGLSDDFFLDVSGLQYRYDASKAAGSRVDIRSIRIDGRRINPAVNYSVTVNEGIAALLSLMGIVPTNVHVLPDLEYYVVRDYIRHLRLVAYLPQGRIRDLSVRQCHNPADDDADIAESTEAAKTPAAPREFQLNQNYPNPFNPSTTISVDIPKESFVSLKVYNLVGQEVASLAGETMQAGTHQFRFDASKLASGTYICQLRAGDLVQTRKMVLLK